MSHHLLAFAGSVAQNAVLANIPTVVDQYMTQVNTSQYTRRDSLRMLRMYARSDSATVVRIDSPYLRLIGPPNIQPIQVSAAPSDLPPINKFDNSALILPALDPLGILCSRAGVGADVSQALIWVSKGGVQKIEQPCFPIQATATITLTTTGSWVAGAITLPQSLPTGKYRILGMSAQGTGLFAARLVVPGMEERPGVLAQQATGEYDHEWFRRGNFGEFGTFDSVAPPTLEAMGYAAGSAQTIWLDVVRLGNITGIS